MRSYMALITLMVLNAPIMAISLIQPNSSHSMNETPGLLHSISTPRDTTFGGRQTTDRHSGTHTWYSQLSDQRLYVSSSRPSALTWLLGSFTAVVPSPSCLQQPPCHSLPVTVTSYFVPYSIGPYFASTRIFQHYMYWLDRRSSFGRHPPGVKDFTIIIWFSVSQVKQVVGGSNIPQDNQL